MNKLQPVALLATGKLMRSFLLDLAGFRERIGPVKAPSLRVASRISNNLQSGFPVGDCQDLGGCNAIFICVPDEMLCEIVREMAEAPLDWAGRAVFLCDSRHTSDSLESVAVLGAFTASLNATPGPGRMILAEGHPVAIASVKPIIGRTARLIRIEADQKAKYFRALEIAELCGPLAALTGERLRDSGLSPADAKPMVASLFGDAVRDYVKSGRKVLSNSTHRTAVLKRVLSAANL
jgi:hypothetical protein